MAEAKSYALSEQSYKVHIDGLLEAEKFIQKQNLIMQTYLQQWSI